MLQLVCTFLALCCDLLDKGIATFLPKCDTSELRKAAFVSCCAMLFDGGPWAYRLKMISELCM